MNLYAINIVGDDEEQLARTLQLQLAQSDVVITSGGVGPTIDDKTKNILANFFNQKLVENEAAAKITKANYLRRQKSWEKGQNHYDLFPEKFFPINNPQGFAPGLGYFFEEQKKPKFSFVENFGFQRILNRKELIQKPLRMRFQQKLPCEVLHLLYMNPLL